MVDLTAAAGGGVWVATNSEVQLFDAAGQRVIAIDPFVEQGQPITALGAARNGSVWVAEPTRVVIVTDQGVASQPRSIQRAGRASRIDHVVELGTSTTQVGSEAFDVLLVTPGSGELVSGATVRVRGVLSHLGTVEVNGIPATVDANLNFVIDVPVSGQGLDLIIATATSAQGEVATTEVVVISDTAPPRLPTVGELQISRVFDSSIGITVVIVSGGPGSVEAESLVILENITSQLRATDITLAAGDGSFSIRVPVVAGDVVELTVIDTGANSTAPLTITVP